MITRDFFVLVVSILFYTNTTTGQVIQGQLLGTWSDPSLVGSAAFNNTYNDIWGFAKDGHEYAIIGSTKGTHIIDVTDPANAFEAYVIDGAAQGEIIIHRDYHDLNGYLYAVADEGQNSTLQIINLNTLPNPPELIYDSSDAIIRAHNIFIDEEAQRLYALAVRTPMGFAAYAIWDISDPLNLTQLKFSSSIGNYLVGHVHDAHVKNNIAYFNCGNDGLVIADFTDPENEILLTTLESSDYPDSGYNHSGWPSEDGKYYFFADETHGMKVKAYDVSDKSDVMLLGTFDAGSTNPKSIAHNLLVKGNRLYISYYYDGLQVYVIEDPSNIQRIMHYPTSQLTATNDYEGAWGAYPYLPSGNILVSDMQEGLFIIQDFMISSTKENELQEYFNLYPNPSSASFTVEWSKKRQVETIKLYSLNGQELYSTRPEKGSSSCSLSTNVAPGIYQVKLSFENGKNSFNKIVIK